MKSVSEKRKRPPGLEPGGLGVRKFDVSLRRPRSEVPGGAIDRVLVDPSGVVGPGRIHRADVCKETGGTAIGRIDRAKSPVAAHAWCRGKRRGDRAHAINVGLVHHQCDHRIALSRRGRHRLVGIGLLHVPRTCATPLVEHGAHGAVKEVSPTDSRQPPRSFALVRPTLMWALCELMQNSLDIVRDRRRR